MPAGVRGGRSTIGDRTASWPARPRPITNTAPVAPEKSSMIRRSGVREARRQARADRATDGVTPAGRISAGATEGTKPNSPR
jgi:hypothetical protein